MGEQVAQDTGKYCYGIKETMQALDMGAVETLIVWENLDLKRIHIRNPHTDAELDVVENIAFVEWIVNNYKTFGAKLEFITVKSQEGNQFCKGFGGVGGMLRYRVEFELFDGPDLGNQDSDDDFNFM